MILARNCKTLSNAQICPFRCSKDKLLKERIKIEISASDEARGASCVHVSVAIYRRGINYVTLWGCERS